MIRIWGCSAAAAALSILANASRRVLKAVRVYETNSQATDRPHRTRWRRNFIMLIPLRMNQEDACHGKITMEYNGEEECVKDSTCKNNIADNGQQAITSLIMLEETKWRRKGKGGGSCWRAIVISVFWIDVTTRREAPPPSKRPKLKQAFVHRASRQRRIRSYSL